MRKSYGVSFVGSESVIYVSHSGIILSMDSANDRGCYYVMPALIGRAHTQNDPCTSVIDMVDTMKLTQPSWLYLSSSCLLHRFMASAVIYSKILTATMILTHLPWTKWSLFCRRYFQMHFREWSFVFSLKFHWSLFVRVQLANNPGIVLDIGLAPNRQQAIISTNAHPIHRRIYVALGWDELAMLDKWVIVFHKKGSQLYAPYQCW